MSQLRLGFIPLNDCAPLIAAQELGLFAAEGLSVELSREASWANVRDKVAVGALDGAHMLGPMALAASMGVGGELTPLTVPLSLNLNGSAITVSTELVQALRETDPVGMAGRPLTARPLHSLIQARQAAGKAPLTFAVVFPYSMHNYQLRYWLATAGIDPDRDLRIVVVPPPRMAERLKSGDIDGFCVTAPWNVQAVSDGTGEILVYASELWRLGPDKVFAVTRAFGDEQPDTLQALIRSMLHAGAWCDAPDNRAELARMLSRADVVGAPEAVIAQSLIGSPDYSPTAPGSASLDYIVYSRYAAAFPWRSHALWFLSQMLRWGQIGPEIDLQAVAASVYRPDLFRQAAMAVGQATPQADAKVEGAHSADWTMDGIAMASDMFFDGRVFNPAKASAYAAEFAIKRLTD
jgi:ABC-type nitrate/sulfonate/bicarbonate transport system substrate-binding protein